MDFALFKKEDLKVGMKVAIKSEINYGWGSYTGLAHYRIKTIEKITPKATKVICDGTEYSTKPCVFFIPCEEMEVENRRANAFEKICAVFSDIRNGKVSPLDLISSADRMENSAKIAEMLSAEFAQKEKEIELADKAMLDSIDISICSGDEWPAQLAAWKRERRSRGALTTYQAKQYAEQIKRR